MRVFAIGIEDPLDATVQRAQVLDRRMHHEVSAACSKDSATTTAPMQPVALSRHHPRAASEQRTVCYHFATRLSHQFRTNTEALCCARVAPTRRDHTGKPVARSERFELPTLGIEIRCSIQLSYERVPGRLSDLALWCQPPLRSRGGGGDPGRYRRRNSGSSDWWRGRRNRRT